MMYRDYKRDLVTGITIRRGTSTNVVLRNYTYDAPGRPLTRSTSRNGTTQNDTFGYNARSELVSATLGSANYAYAFDNIGNRETASVAGTQSSYSTNNLNQYTEIIPSESSASSVFNPVYDADGNWFTYGYDITKNICEVFGPAGYIRTAYSYAPFGSVSESGDVSQPFQWSSEVYDSELDLVYYNYRHYSPTLGRFLSRDPIAEQGGLNLYAFVKNSENRSSRCNDRNSSSSVACCRKDYHGRYWYWN